MAFDTSCHETMTCGRCFSTDHGGAGSIVMPYSSGRFGPVVGYPHQFAPEDSTGGG